MCTPRNNIKWTSGLRYYAISHTEMAFDSQIANPPGLAAFLRTTEPDITLAYSCRTSFERFDTGAITVRVKCRNIGEQDSDRTRVELG